MPARTFYEPMVEQTREPSPIRGFQVTIGGTYVLLDDVVTSLREYAQSLHDPGDGALIHELATWLVSGERQLPEQMSLDTAAVGEPEPPDPQQEIVDRVEVYPDDPTSERPRWIARACDSEGKILTVTNGSFDQEYVIQNAGERWPGKPVHLLADASQDTVWEENDPGGIRSPLTSRRRPSPNRLWINT